VGFIWRESAHAFINRVTLRTGAAPLCGWQQVAEGDFSQGLKLDVGMAAGPLVRMKFSEIPL
jgi:hypothetical protein